MKSKSKKICLLFAGGTTVLDKDIRGSTVYGPGDIPGWLALAPEVSLMAQIEPVFVAADNELIGAPLWQKISQEIYRRLNDFDGFVVLTDLDSVLYAGTALSFALRNINKPVILTSSQITEANVKLPDWLAKKAKAYGGLGVKANLINAVQLATMNLPAVALMFGNRIIRAVKAQRSGFLGLNIFKSADESYLGRIDFSISLTEKFKNIPAPVVLKNGFETNISIHHYFPGADLQDLNRQKIRGRLLQGLADIDLLKNYKSLTPLIVHNRFLFDVPDQENILIINNMTWETCLVKFMWALSQSKRLAEVRGFMFNEHADEFIL